MYTCFVHNNRINDVMELPRCCPNTAIQECDGRKGCHRLCDATLSAAAISGRANTMPLLQLPPAGHAASDEGERVSTNTESVPFQGVCLTQLCNQC